MTGKLAFVGAGRLACTLAPAMARCGHDVVAVGARNPDSARQLAHAVGGDCQAMDIQDAADGADLVFLSVSDGAIEEVARAIRWRAGQQVVHCSGATEVSVLESARDAGASVGGFHPIQLFADPDVAARHIAGSSVAIEASGALESNLVAIARSLGYQVIHLPPGVRARYHAATNFSASFLLSLLHEACTLWSTCGIDSKQALEALVPLARGAIEAAAANGLPGALAGPFSRGDAGVVRSHLADLQALGTDAALFYRLIGLRQIELAKARGALPDEAIESLRKALMTAQTSGTVSV